VIQSYGEGGLKDEAETVYGSSEMDNSLNDFFVDVILFQPIH
jgi:hypothetical protein